MSHHFVQQLIHVMWATRNQEFTLTDSIRKELYAYLSTVIKSKEGYLLLADGSQDHVHCLISMPPVMSLSNMMQLIKSFTSKWLKTKSEIHPNFSWQDGYAAISLQDDRKGSVFSYIKNDVQRHCTMNYRDELTKILTMQNMSFNEKYLLESSYSKVFVHSIWTTKNRIPYLDKSIRPLVYSEISQAIKKSKGVTHAIGGVEDHVHLLMEIPKDMALSDIIREVKCSGINILKAHDSSFEWQTGYGAFSISLSTVETVKRYIDNQEEHHKKSTTLDEWKEFISKKGLVHY